MTITTTRRKIIFGALFAALSMLPTIAPATAQEKLKELRIDWATYNPLSILIKNEKLLEKEFEKDGISVRWVQSLGSNKALEFLNASSLDFGSTAGAAALIARINGNPIKAVDIYSKPEWTALVTGKDSTITKIEDLKGKRVAVTRGTDPHIFLVRALQSKGLSEKDITVVPLQHGDGRTALERGDVDAWAGLDPLMAAAEVEKGAKLFYRNADANTLGVLNVREAFAKDYPDVTRRVLKVYAQARSLAKASPDKIKAGLIEAAKLPDAVIAKQIERTDLSPRAFGEKEQATILAAGVALQGAGVLKPEVDVAAVTKQLIDTSYQSK